MLATFEHVDDEVDHEDGAREREGRVDGVPSDVRALEDPVATRGEVASENSRYRVREGRRGGARSED